MTQIKLFNYIISLVGMQEKRQSFCPGMQERLPSYAFIYLK
ncbi:hypothetical protein HMPREF3201_00740 [Megasphaera sp. MJR8396C]|nr:hypothetical protein HMPREF3201_00740 [Megasphaera sp. MJR8396C]